MALTIRETTVAEADNGDRDFPPLEAPSLMYVCLKGIASKGTWLDRLRAYTGAAGNESTEAAMSEKDSDEADLGQQIEIHIEGEATYDEIVDTFHELCHRLRMVGRKQWSQAAQASFYKRVDLVDRQELPLAKSFYQFVDAYAEEHGVSHLFEQLSPDISDEPKDALELAIEDVAFGFVSSEDWRAQQSVGDERLGSIISNVRNRVNQSPDGEERYAPLLRSLCSFSVDIFKHVVSERRAQQSQTPDRPKGPDGPSIDQ